ncbi:hypothetical protein CCHR01_13691 [Colletotrichum chrysophilum]|uniref:Uncharacterized protein n=1 Tax=Colletotrichum chrysophilum TaxID=1836956 RepID=A0AAD9EDH7_9PEZI|nr:hypothetical protein CCHR01_13691 [Colletotrichum chrysophilum]
MWPFPSHVCFTSPTTSATGSGYDRIAKEGTESRHFDTPTKIQPYTHRQAKHTIPTSTFLPRRLMADRAALFFFVAAGVFYTTDNRIFSSPIILSSPLRSPTKIRVASLDPAFPFVIFPRFSGGIGLIDESAKCNRHATRSRSLVEVELVRLVEERSENRL